MLLNTWRVFEEPLLKTHIAGSRHVWKLVEQFVTRGEESASPTRDALPCLVIIYSCIDDSVPRFLDVGSLVVSSCPFKLCDKMFATNST